MAGLIHGCNMTDISNIEDVIEPHESQASRGLWDEAARRFLRHRLATFGLIMLVLLVLSAIFAPLLSAYSPTEIDLRGRGQGPSWAHLLGTDGTGRDVLSRVLHGGRISLSVGVIAVSISAVIGVIIGTVSGYFGGKIDLILLGITDMFLTFPRLVIIIAVVAILGPNIFNAIIVIGLLSWPAIARLTRGEILRLRQQQYIQAAKSLGTSDFRIIIEHVLPNVMSPVLVAVTLDVATIILVEASLSFLGLGAQAPTPSWGNMLRDARSLSILEGQPWLWLPPGLMIALAVLSINSIGDGLRDALDPRHISGDGS